MVIQDGDTALHLAAHKDHPGCVEVLLDKGANVTAKDDVSGE